MTEDNAATIVIGGSRSIGLELVRHFASRGDRVVMTGRDRAAVDETARGVGGDVRSVVLDLTRPKEIAAALADVGAVRRLILVAIDRDQNSVADYDIDRAISLTTLKLVGYTEVVHTLIGRFTSDASIVMFGGQARFLPYPGSTTVTTVNGGVEGLVRALMHELKPLRVNCIHPGIVGDSPYWETRQAYLATTLARTPAGRLTTMHDIVDATAFLLDNPAINGVELRVDGGLHGS